MRGLYGVVDGGAVNIAAEMAVILRLADAPDLRLAAVIDGCRRARADLIGRGSDPGTQCFGRHRAEK